MFVRFDLAAIAAAAIFASSGCGEEKNAGPAKETLEKSEEIARTEEALLGKRDALFEMRSELVQKREALNEKRRKVREEGGDLAEIDDKAAALLEEERKLTQQERELNKNLQQILDERETILTAMAAGGGASSDVPQREAGVARRERALAEREKSVADREAAISRREENLASKWKDSCASMSTVPQTIIKTVDVKGSSYTKKDIEPLLKRARSSMNSKGLLASDLPDPAKGLESEANKAMKEGDYGRARLAANQLLSTVRGLKIDKGFIAAKISRLNSRMRGKKLSKKVEGLFRDATGLYGDAQFSKANRKLNAIYSSL